MSAAATGSVPNVFIQANELNERLSSMQGFALFLDRHPEELSAHNTLMALGSLEKLHKVFADLTPTMYSSNELEYLKDKIEPKIALLNAFRLNLKNQVDGELKSFESFAREEFQRFFPQTREYMVVYEAKKVIAYVNRVLTRVPTLARLNHPHVHEFQHTYENLLTQVFSEEIYQIQSQPSARRSFLNLLSLFDQRSNFLFRYHFISNANKQRIHGQITQIVMYLNQRLHHQFQAEEALARWLNRKNFLIDLLEGNLGREISIDDPHVLDPLERKNIFHALKTSSKESTVNREESLIDQPISSWATKSDLMGAICYYFDSQIFHILPQQEILYSEMHQACLNLSIKPHYGLDFPLNLPIPPCPVYKMSHELQMGCLDNMIEALNQDDWKEVHSLLMRFKGEEEFDRLNFINPIHEILNIRFCPNSFQIKEKYSRVIHQIYLQILQQAIENAAQEGNEPKRKRLLAIYRTKSQQQNPFPLPQKQLER